jgi:hypothetical protein
MRAIFNMGLKRRRFNPFSAEKFMPESSVIIAEGFGKLFKLLISILFAFSTRS